MRRRAGWLARRFRPGVVLRVVLGVAALALVVAGSSAGAEESAIQTTLTVTTPDGVVPARIVARNRLCDSSGGCKLLLLVEPRDRDEAGEESEERGEAGHRSSRESERSLVAVGLGRDGGFEVEMLASGLDSEVSTPAALDLDGDGREEPLLGRPGELLRVQDGVPRILFARRFFDLATVEPLLARADDGGSGAARALLPIPTVGQLEFVRVGGGRPGRVVASVALPVRARRSGRAVRLQTPAVLQIPGGGENASETLELLTMPVEEGPGRWSVRRMTIAGPDAAHIESEDLFLSTPGAERPVYGRAVRVGGEPMLLVHALRSDKVGIFERKKVRLYPLRPDRTRQGNRSVVAVETISRLWQDLGSELADLDGDGFVDLLLFQREGFSGKKLQVEMVRGTGHGSFANDRSRRVLFPEPPFADWVWGRDVTGDGLLDLALVSDRLAIHAGNGGRKGGVFLAAPTESMQLERAAPRESLAISVSVDSEGASGSSSNEVDEDTEDVAQAADRDSEAEKVRWTDPQWLDLDGDGNPELVLSGQSRSGDRIWVLGSN